MTEYLAIPPATHEPVDLHTQVMGWARAPRPQSAGPVDWRKERQETKSIAEFVDRLFDKIMALPPEIRASELSRVLRDIDPRLDEGAHQEAQLLMSRGADPRRALRAALGASLVARRKKHYWILQHEVIPLHAKRIAEGVYKLDLSPPERALRIKNLIESLVPKNKPRYSNKEAAIRLRELGMSPVQVRAALRARKLTSALVAQRLQRLIKQGVTPQEALQQVIEMAMRAFALDSLKAQGVAHGVMFCGPVIAIISAVLGLAGTVVGIAVPAAQAARARREAQAAEERQRRAPLLSGEIDQLAATLAQGHVAWATARQGALDFIRVNRFGRAEFVEPEERQLQARFQQVRAAIVAAQEAARNRKILIGAGVGAVALVGVVVAVKASRKKTPAPTK